MAAGCDHSRDRRPLAFGQFDYSTAAPLSPGCSALAVVTGIIESSMARLRLLRVTQLLIAAIVLSGLALALVQR